MKANKITMKNIPMFALGIVQDLKEYPGIKKVRTKKRKRSLSYIVSGYGDFDDNQLYHHLHNRLKHYYLRYFHINGENEINKMKQIKKTLEIKERVIKKILSDKIEDLSLQKNNE